jgi:hypothetical protein
MVRRVSGLAVVVLALLALMLVIGALASPLAVPGG